jgi:hypothetical protein
MMSRGGSGSGTRVAVSGATSKRAGGVELPRSMERRAALEQVADDGGDQHWHPAVKIDRLVVDLCFVASLHDVGKHIDPRNWWRRHGQWLLR